MQEYHVTLRRAPDTGDTVALVTPPGWQGWCFGVASPSPTAALLSARGWCRAREHGHAHLTLDDPGRLAPLELLVEMGLVSAPRQHLNGHARKGARK